MPEIKTCEEYVLAELANKDLEIDSLKKQVREKDLCVTTLKEQVENAKNLLRTYLGLKIRDAYNGNPMIDVEPVISSEYSHTYEEALTLLHSLFKIEELRQE